ncbi:hypothetical protein [Flavobacterium stagni]|uniref:DUF5071 domain-containing protein n=1 Tax=Flavobacterium stagni TaxID=2506421 RepID=A0A4Q1KAV5_9FLAO|nr:hypothetical protein [Flavobacterium stagni]RXR23957.1 hypothetical protein EQG61_00520 [Flavobacterium stagni]
MKVNELMIEINNLLLHPMGRYEIDGYFWRAHKILETFTSQDWEDLKIDLPKWSQNQLDFLVETLFKGDGLNDPMDDNFFIGYIFTLSENQLASYILSERLHYFLIEQNITSTVLLQSILNRINQLQKTEYRCEENIYAFYVNKINEIMKDL